MPGSIQESSFEDFIQSSLFTFNVGAEGKQFVVHSKAVAATSEYFRALVEGGMLESQKRCAQLPDVEPEDFTRYLEYAYHHDYTEPSWVCDDEPVQQSTSTTPAQMYEPIVLVEEAAPTLDVYTEDGPTEVYVDPWNFGMVPKTKKKRTLSYAESAQLSRNAIRSRFEARKYLSEGEPRTAVLKQFAPRSNTAPQQDFTPIFLAHARLYTFADMHLIEPLRKLALHKLHKTLSKFKLYPERVGDVVELTRYAHSNGNDRGVNGVVEDLRKLVVEYIVSELSTFKIHPSFLSLLEEGGEFVSNLWSTVVQENLL